MKNNWKQPRAAGKVPAINVFGSYYGYSPYSSTMIAGGHGLGYPYSSCYPRYGYGYHGACGFRYPVYGLYGAAGYRFDDDYYDDDYVEAGPYLDPVEAEIAMEAWEDRTQAALESEALDDFGERHADAEGPAGAAGKGASAMSPTVVETARQIGIALDRGDKAFEKGQYDQARAEYLQALALAGEDATARVALGLAEYALASFDAASSEIRKGVARAPSLAHSAFNLRSVYGNQRDFEAHVRILEDHVGQNPADSESRFLLGFVRYFSGDRAGGVALLETYLADPAHDDSVREFIETARVTMP
ncbi:MAG TPA: tetratricopeptide repeat protein [Phycisphaerae bacterium]|nr:tetratricopeptide repeat protein [Phycisphaerae bacterium]